MLQGHRDPQEKYSIIISYVFLKNFQDSSRTFSFFQDFSTSFRVQGNHPGLPGCMGTMQPLQQLHQKLLKNEACLTLKGSREAVKLAKTKAHSYRCEVN